MGEARIQERCVVFQGGCGVRIFIFQEERGSEAKDIGERVLMTNDIERSGSRDTLEGCIYDRRESILLKLERMDGCEHLPKWNFL